jgi:hypothetical protein
MTTNKASFVRRSPPDVSARELRARAKAEGIEISENLVYALRRNLQQNASPPPRVGFFQRLGGLWRRLLGR